jgi:hypothetical protein
MKGVFTMFTWLQKHAWWIGLVITFFIALFPSAFAIVGECIIYTLTHHWLPLGIVIIIGLLIALVAMNAKRAP